MANTHGEKELKTDWDSLTTSDSTKGIGHKQTLEARNSLILENGKEGIYF
jgi:hypothetical protein